MPVVPGNQVTSTQKKAPWVKDSGSNSQGGDVPWRKPAAKSSQSSENSTATATEKPGASKPPSATEKTKPEPKKGQKTEGSSAQASTTNSTPATKSGTKKSLPTKLGEPVTSTTKASDTNSSNMSKKPPPAPAPPPPPPGLPPPPPPPPTGKPPVEKVTNPTHLARLEQLRKVPRRRPDWGTMMKEIEKGKKLKKVECNDRSKPIIPRMKSLGKFVFDSEAKPASKTDAIHNKLLTEIQHGVKLKKVQCNDRSKPLLSGLRKFRRQLTIEEQKKSGAGEEAVEPPPELLLDETDDIDALRDDLQSAKQMLELELEAKTKVGKENRDLQCQLIALEAENEKLKAQLGLIPESQVSALVRRDSRAFKDLKKSRSGLYKSSSGIKKSKSGFGDPKSRSMKEEDDLGELNELEEEVSALKGQVLLIRNTAQEWEAKYHEASQKLLVSQGNFEDCEQKRIMLEKKLELMQSKKGVSAVVTQEKSVQTEDIGQRRVSKQSGDSTFSNQSESEEEVDSDLELDDATVLRKKQERELKLWENKLKSVKEKQVNCKTERKNLKAEQKSLEQELKDGKVRLKALQKEVDKMASLLKTDETKEDEEEEEEESEEESEEETSSEEEESASEDSEESEEDSSAPENATHDEQLNILTNHVKRGDNILNALRKGNYLLRANIDHLKDDLEGVRIKYHELEHELNVVLADV